MDNNSMAIKKLKFHMTGRNQQIVPCLVGPTGIGKTAIGNQVAKELGAELIYFNMSQQNQGDNALPVPQNGDMKAMLKSFVEMIVKALSGQPVDMDDEDENNTEKTLVKYALHHKFQEIIDNPDKKYIVMCDEIARAQIPVISEWMTVLTELQIQGQKFGKNVRFIAAMNPSSTMKGYEDTDYIATEMDPAHLTRFNFIYMKEDRLDWLEWAKRNDIHPFVIQFLEDAKHFGFFYGQPTDDVRMRTPKGWHQLSDMLKDLEESGAFESDRAFTASIISDQIGYDAGPLFAKMMWETLETIPLEKVASGKPVDQKLVERFASHELQKQIVTVDSWIAEMKESNPTFTKQDVSNFIAFWDKMKSDDAKVKVAHQITHNFLETKDGAIVPTCVAALFYNETGDTSYNKPFIDFMSRMTQLADVS